MSSSDEALQRRRTQLVSSSSTNSRTSLITPDISLISKPVGIRLFGACFQFSSIQSKRTFHKALVLLLTYIAYTAFHMGRRPLSIVKNVLNRNCSALPNHHNLSVGTLLVPLYPDINNDQVQEDTLELNYQAAPYLITSNSTDNSSCNWAPFDDNTTANQLLAILDSSFLLAYAIFMFFSGLIAERVNLRYFISIGSVFSGLGIIAFGLAYPLNIHSMAYFILVQVAAGAAQTSGWPVVVTCVSNWFEPAKRGLIYGFWNSHTNVGNILGATIAGFFVETDWGLSFIVPGSIMIGIGAILFLFLVPTPRDVDLGLHSMINEDPEMNSQSDHSSSTSGCYNDRGSMKNSSSSTSIARSSSSNEKDIVPNHRAVSFSTALRIPGVIEYSMCLFFSKLVSYTFLYWLPRYITSSTTNNSEDSAYLSTPFDVGGVAGAIVAGYLSDRYNLNSVVCMVMFILAIPSMFTYQKFGSLSTWNNIILQLICGAFVNGPYCLITTAVSADLGNRIKDGRAMATVAAIIDGMGSVGAVLGPLFAGFVSNSGDWQSVFMMLIFADILASLCLLRLTIHEVKGRCCSRSGTTLSATGGDWLA